MKKYQPQEPSSMKKSRAEQSQTWKMCYFQRCLYIELEVEMPKILTVLNPAIYNFNAFWRYVCFNFNNVVLKIEFFSFLIDL